MALSEELFPPKIINGEEIAHPATVYSFPRPTMRPVQLSDEMFPRENTAGAHFMTPIDTSLPHRRGPRDIPLMQLITEASATRDRTAANRERLSQRFIQAGFAQLAVGVSERATIRIATMQQSIDTLQNRLDAATAVKIGATVVIPE